MKRMIKILAISMVIGGILAAVLAGTVFAAGPSGGQNTAPNAGEDAGWGNGRGLGFGPDSAAAELLGLTPEEIREQRQDGKSLVQIAASGNVTEAALIDAIMAEKTADIEDLAAEGTITREEADLRLAQMEERVTLAVNRTLTGPPEWAGANGQGLNSMERGNGKGNWNQAGKGSGGMRQGEQAGFQAGCTGTPVTGTGTGGMMRFGRGNR